jgi:uncharacterized protein (DUF362 family)
MPIRQLRHMRQLIESVQEKKMTTKRSEKNHDPAAPVAVCAIKTHAEALKEAIALCDGFKNLDKGMRVLIKPNLVVWIDRYPYAPYGVITTSALIEEVIKMLVNYGVTDITVADGCARNKAVGSETHILFDRLGYHQWTEKYGVKLVDLNEDKTKKVTMGHHELKVAQTVIDSDFIIDMPALKTHEFTKVTLGFKNLKGCLPTKSKQTCHNGQFSLDDYVYNIADTLYPDLTIIDGTYMLELGPMHTGTAQRSDLLVAGRDMFSVDVVGAALMSVNSQDVEHLRLFAKNNDRSLDVKDIDVKGVSIEDHARKLQIETPWSEDGSKPMVFEKQNLKGFDMRFPNICTGCAYVFPFITLMILGANTGEPFDDLELLSGRQSIPSGKAKKSFLIGNCPIIEHKKNETIKDAIQIKGCPPKLEDVVEAFNANGVTAKMETIDRFMGYLVKRYEKMNFPKEEYWLQ